MDKLNELQKKLEDKSDKINSKVMELKQILPKISGEYKICKGFITELIKRLEEVKETVDDLREETTLERIAELRDYTNIPAYFNRCLNAAIDKTPQNWKLNEDQMFITDDDSNVKKVVTNKNGCNVYRGYEHNKNGTKDLFYDILPKSEVSTFGDYELYHSAMIEHEIKLTGNNFKIKQLVSEQNRDVLNKISNKEEPVEVKTCNIFLLGGGEMRVELAIAASAQSFIIGNVRQSIRVSKSDWRII